MSTLILRASYLALHAGVAAILLLWDEHECAAC